MGEKNVEMQTLVKYNNPVLVVKHVEKKTTAEDACKRISSMGLVDTKKEFEEILNAILPPRCWEEHGQLWAQTISTTPATRQDLVNLQEMLDSRLKQVQARETGICPLRRALYSQCFDELIRQVTINCTDRGLLLLRVRDEIAMSMDAYETLYSSSIAYGLRKALQSQEEKEQLRDKLKNLETEKIALEEIITEMKVRMDQADRRHAELRATEERKFQEEVNFLKKTNAQLKAQLEGVIAPKK